MDKSVWEIIEALIDKNMENIGYLRTNYDAGYQNGYHDALVDLLNQLNICHYYNCSNE